MDATNFCDSQVAEPNVGSPAASAGNELPSSRELERLNEELRQLNGEKLKLEEEVNREEATIKLKQSEIKSMQNETETLHQMVRQLDVQKGEARKRLDDLTSQVDKLKADVNEQKSKVTAEEEEVATKKKELDQIRSEESLLQAKLANLKRDIDSLSNVSGQMQLQISQAKAILVSLEEFQSRLKEGTAEIETAITNNDIHKLNTLIARPLTPPPELKTVDTTSTSAFDGDPFKDTSLVHDLSGDPFAGEDPFGGEDPFSQPTGGGGGGGSGGAFSNDSAWDPFGSSSNQSAFPDSSDAFDPFGTLAIPPKPSTNDPFANTAKTDSAPELPPKGKIGSGAPPRPLLPKSGKASNGGNKPADAWGVSDPFGSSSTTTANDSFDPFGNSGNFANFDQM